MLYAALQKYIKNTLTCIENEQFSMKTCITKFDSRSDRKLEETNNIG